MLDIALIADIGARCVIDIHPAVKRTGIPSTSTNQKLTTVEILVGLTLHRMQLL
jgi:hypothetical protein